MKWENLSAEETLKNLKSDAEKGLTTSAAKERSLKYGKNELVEKRKPAH